LAADESAAYRPAAFTGFVSGRLLLLITHAAKHSAIYYFLRDASRVSGVRVAFVRLRSCAPIQLWVAQSDIFLAAGLTDKRQTSVNGNLWQQFLL